MKKILLIPLFLVLAAAGGYFYGSKHSSTNQENYTPPIEHRTLTSDVLERIDIELKNNDDLSVNIAAKLISCDMEQLLFDLCKKKNLKLNCKVKSMDCYVDELFDNRIISKEEMKQMDKFRRNIRNAAAHTNSASEFSRNDVDEAFQLLKKMKKKFKQKG